jgi:hypothetical protein
MVAVNRAADGAADARRRAAIGLVAMGAVAASLAIAMLLWSAAAGGGRLPSPPPPASELSASEVPASELSGPANWANWANSANSARAAHREPLAPRSEALRVGAALSPSAARRMPAPAAWGRVRILGVDLATRQPLHELAWRAAGDVVGMMPHGVARAGEALLDVPLGMDASVTVSAPGYRESLPIDVSLRGASYRVVEAPLAPVGAGSAVVLRATAQGGLPVTRLQVRWDAQDPASSRRAARRGEPRISVAADGRHAIELPEAGWGTLYAVPVDDADMPLPLLPCALKVRVRDECLELPDWRFEPGVALVVDAPRPCADASGSSLRLGTESGVTLPLRFGLASASLGEPAPGFVRCVAEHAVAAARYRLLLDDGGRLREQTIAAWTNGRLRIEAR